MKSSSVFFITLLFSFSAFCQQDSTSFTHLGNGFHSDSVSMNYWDTQSITLNKILDRSPGVRVRQEGGFGSKYTYQLDGMYGNSVRMFIDGIPVEYLGDGYAINNFNPALANHVEVYKGVTPVELGDDALGGAINIKTHQADTSYLNASYSYGSLNTHRAHLQGQFVEPNSGFTTRLSSYYTGTDNNYKVWGKGVYIIDENYRQTEVTKDKAVERFNDDFRIAHARLDMGFTQRKWADKFLLGFTVSDREKGIQHGPTIAMVYGEVRSDQQFYMPSLTYEKDNLFTNGLSLSVFAGYGIRTNTLIDTSRYIYNWEGEAEAERVQPGEMSQGGIFESVIDKTLITRINPRYAINENQTLSLNFTRQGINREFEPEENYNTLNEEPLSYAKNFIGLSHSGNWISNKWKTNLFAKYYTVNASGTQIPPYYGSEKQEIEYQKGFFGYGLATSYQLLQWTFINASVEKAVRMPGMYETIGVGYVLQPNINLEPEQSTNINAGFKLNLLQSNSIHNVEIQATGFYRNIKDRIVQIQTGSYAYYENMDKVLNKGIESEVSYAFRKMIFLSVNTTYFNMVDNQKERNGNSNLTYKYRIPNQPYFMVNATLRLRLEDMLQQNSVITAYVQSGYVHDFDYNYQTIGVSGNDRVIPSQQVIDLGLSYSFPIGISLAVDVSNVFDKQVYDYYTLQRPGRMAFVKLSYRI